MVPEMGKANNPGDRAARLFSCRVTGKVVKSGGVNPRRPRSGGFGVALSFAAYHFMLQCHLLANGNTVFVLTEFLVQSFNRIGIRGTPPLAWRQSGGGERRRLPPR
jgi:hypothetical protein